MGTWTDVSGDLQPSPITSDGHPFWNTAKHFSSIACHLETVVHRLRQLSSGDATEFQGEAANAFTRKMSLFVKDMQDVPGVASNVSGIFESHARAMDDLQRRVSSALARALTHRAQRDADRGTLTASQGNLASIKRQVQNLKSVGTDAHDPHLVSLQAKQASAATAVTTAQRHLSSTQADLDASIREYHGFVEEQHRLDGQTAGQLDHIDLHGLQDPSWLEKYILHPTGEFFADLAGAATAALKGHWDEAAWRLHDVIKFLGIVLLVVTAIAAVVLLGAALVVAGAAVLGAAAIGAAAATVVAAAGAVLTFVGTVGFWLTLVKSVDDAGLYAAGKPDSESGEKISTAELLMDAADLALLGLGKHFDAVVGDRLQMDVNGDLHGAGGRYISETTLKERAFLEGNHTVFVEPAEHAKTIHDAVEAPDPTRARADHDRDLEGLHIVPVPTSSVGPSTGMLCPAGAGGGSSW
jgi:hypothetical protein